MSIAPRTLEQLSDAAIMASEPSIVSAYIPALGGVDPLGLRQINFDLMDVVIPGLNNIARHIRPFTVVTWAWHRAAICARDQGRKSIGLSELRDFVARIEVIYAWSQFLRSPRADLPGRDVLSTLINSESYVFGGKPWRQRQEIREYSTAFSAPINYGPALRALGWLQPDPDGTGALVATTSVLAALQAFEGEISHFIVHPAFSRFGQVEVKTEEARNWADAWALERPTAAEQHAMTELLAGAVAPSRRREGVELVMAAADYLGPTADLDTLRRTMCGRPTDFDVAPAGAAAAWRAVQVRQAFRYALELFFFWTQSALDDGPKPTAELVAMFLAACSPSSLTSKEWLEGVLDDAVGPTDWIDRLEEASNGDLISDLPEAIRGAIAACLAETSVEATSEREDRLPLVRAAKEAAGWASSSPAAFVTHVLESWVLGQHVYWSVGRGLADARARGKSILRLKVVMEEYGWTLAPGAGAASRNAPAPTPDRLETLISLLRETGMIEVAKQEK